jgi:hypothetical protein
MHYFYTIDSFCAQQLSIKYFFHIVVEVWEHPFLGVFRFQFSLYGIIHGFSSYSLVILFHFWSFMLCMSVMCLTFLSIYYISFVPFFVLPFMVFHCSLTFKNLEDFSLDFQIYCFKFKLLGNICKKFTSIKNFKTLVIIKE